MRSNEQGRSTQVIACAWIVVVHAGLFWLLGLHDRVSGRQSDETRMRLAFVERIVRPSARPPLPPAPRRGLRTLPARSDRPSVEIASKRAERDPAAALTATATAGELLEQGREWARQQAPAPSFASDPLRSRRAQLPGGDRPESFRMRDPLTPARVVGFIGKLFGDPGPPCPRIKDGIQGLLTATSDRERDLLDEELRRDREYCRP